MKDIEHLLSSDVLDRYKTEMEELTCNLAEGFQVCFVEGDALKKIPREQA